MLQNKSVKKVNTYIALSKYLEDKDIKDYVNIDVRRTIERLLEEEKDKTKEEELRSILETFEKEEEQNDEMLQNDYDASLCLEDNCNFNGFEVKIDKVPEGKSSFKIKVTATSQAEVDNLLLSFHGEIEETKFEIGDDGALYLAVYDNNMSKDPDFFFDKINEVICKTDYRKNYLETLPEEIQNEQISIMLENPSTMKKYDDRSKFSYTEVSENAKNTLSKFNDYLNSSDNEYSYNKNYMD